MDDDDPALGLKVIFLVLSIVLVMGSVSPTIVKSNEEVKPVLINNTGAKSSLIDKEVPKRNVVSGYFKPSGIYDGNNHKWTYNKFLNYCTNCHHYNTLGVWKYCPERQISCRRCDSDYSGVSGYEKMNPPRSRLRRV